MGLRAYRAPHSKTEKGVLNNPRPRLREFVSPVSLRIPSRTSPRILRTSRFIASVFTRASRLCTRDSAVLVTSQQRPWSPGDVQRLFMSSHVDRGFCRGPRTGTSQPMKYGNRVIIRLLSIIRDPKEIVRNEER